MPLDVLMIIAAVGLRAHLLGREDLDSHLTKEHFVSVVKVIMCLSRHSYEASVELSDAFVGF